MSWVSVGVVGGGALLSGVGGLVGGNKQRSDAQGQQERTQQQSLGQRDALAGIFYGPEYQKYITRIQYAQDAIDRNHRDYGGGSESPENQKILAWAQKEIADATNEFNTSKSGGLLGQIKQISQQAIGNDNRQLGVFANQSKLFAQRGQDQVNAAQGYGQNQANLINQNYARDLTGANKLTQARANASGLGASSTALNQMAGNAAVLGRGRDQSLQDSANARIDRTTSTMQQAKADDMSRAAAGTALWGNLSQDRRNLKMGPINAQLGIQQSGIMNPNYAQGQIVPTSNPLGNFLGSVGNTAGMLGAYGLSSGQSLFGGQQQQTPGLAGNGFSRPMFCDRRLKRDITRVGTAGGIPLYRFRYSEGAIRTGRGATGFHVGPMAQDVLRVAPGLVGTDAGGFLYLRIGV